MGSIDPFYLVNNERHIQCPFLNVSSFVSFCEARGIDTSREQLERFEKLRLFFPLYRVEYPPIREKIQYVDEGRGYNVIGVVEDDEDWSGDTRDGYGYFEFSERFVEPFRQAGLLWAPSERSFSPWDDFIGKNGYTRVESFYSPFQVFHLRRVIACLTVELRLEWGPTWDADVLEKMLVGLDELFASLRGRTIERDVAFVCQAISNRYFPNTQSDRRSIRISYPTRHDDWDWDEYRRNWNPSAEIGHLGISTDEVKRMAGHVAHTASFVDPLESWYGLITFVSLTKKEKLKGKALLAQTLYSAEKMLRMLYQDLTGVELPPPDESANWKKDFYYGEGVTKNPRRYLEFLANEYHLNPRPRLILVVEGHGEELVVPTLAEKLFGVSLESLGLEILNLNGIGNFEGRDKRDPAGLLLRFIDDNHHRNTIVFVVLDNEGRVSRVKQRLLEARSQYGKDRNVTRPEYIHTWDRSVEFDNFSDDEIAAALSEQSPHHAFTAENVKAIRDRTVPGTLKRSDLAAGAELVRLFSEVAGRNLDKPALLESLCRYIIAEAEESKGTRERRPMEKILQRIIKLASINHPPQAQETWDKNQRSGYFGSAGSPDQDDFGKFIVDG